MSLGGQYTWASAFGDVTLHSDASETGNAQLTIGDGNSYRDPFLLVDARLPFDPAGVPGLELALQGTNLTNKLYYTYQQTQTATDELLGAAAGPREIYGSVRYSF